MSFKAATNILVQIYFTLRACNVWCGALHYKLHPWALMINKIRLHKHQYPYKIRDSHSMQIYFEGFMELTTILKIWRTWCQIQCRLGNLGNQSYSEFLKYSEPKIPVKNSRGRFVWFKAVLSRDGKFVVQCTFWFIWM